MSKLANTSSKLSLLGQTVHFSSSESMNEIKESVNLVFTSPPYWMIKDYEHKDQIGLEKTYQEYLDRLNLVWDECYRVTKDNALLAINIGTKRHQGQFYPIGMDIYKNMEKWKLIDRIIWYIPNALTQPNYYTDKLPDSKFEDVLIFAKNYDYKHTFNKIRVPQKYKIRDARKNNKHPDGRSIGNVIRLRAYRPPPIKKMNYHQAAYPEDLVHFILKSYSNEGDTVLDPFVGSGTTLKVARHTERKGIGFEINSSSDVRTLIENRINEDWKPIPFAEMDMMRGEVLPKNNKNENTNFSSQR